MCPFRKYPVLQPLLSPLRLSQQKTLVLFIASIAEVAQAASIQLMMILASVVVGCRAILVYNKVISKTLMERSQNKEENEFLKSIASTL